MRKIRQAGWYSRKAYPHFDLPLDFPCAEALVSDPVAVAKHSFLPFVGFTDKKRRFTPRNSIAKYKVKERDLKYCSHHDGYIHSYYAKLLQELYEAYLARHPFGSSVIGYRAGLGTNIDLAKSAFEEVRERSACVAIAIDINNFFPSIAHNKLFLNLTRVVLTPRLSDDWFAIYKSMTKFSFIELGSLAVALSFDIDNPPRPFCDIATFRKIRKTVPNLVQVNQNPNGIPQ
jgi:hypothetical protein